MFTSVQSALDPRGPNAAVLAEIAWVLVIGGSVILVAVVALAACAVWRPPQWLRRDGVIVGGGVVFPFVVLAALLVYTLARTASLGSTATPEVRIRILAHQWWWEVAYLRRDGEVDFDTANELRIPAGRSVELELRTADVLHSFWVPSLAGKLDMIPGKDNRLRISGSRPGIYRGQCAEYCGGPHAQMALYVVVEEVQAFEDWRARQRLPAAPPGEARLSQGEELFLARCAACHTVRGTPAEGRLGPDLTHVGSRLSLGAGTLPNNVGTLAGWIASSQHVKPGNLMPSFREFGAEELPAIAAYLASLK